MLAHAAPGTWALFGWSIAPLPVLSLAALAALWLVGVRHVRTRSVGIGQARPIPRSRSILFLAGLATLFVALCSPIDTYADDLFSLHMLQHLLIAFVAAPLLVLAAPGTLALRAAPPAVRRRVLVPLLRSRPVRWLTFPLTTWLVFGAVMWLAHFTPLFELALESDGIHELEHAAFLVAGFLYWLPAIGSDPLPWRLGVSGRLLYLLLGMPVSSVLGLVIVGQTSVMYSHYAGPGALADQRLAGTVMWLGGDLIGAVLIGVAGWLWLRAETRRARNRAAHGPLGARMR